MPRRGRIAWGVGCGVAAAYLAAAVYLYAVQDSLVLPRTVNPLPGPQQGLPYEVLTIPVEGATLHGIYFPATAPSATLVLAFGGNAHDVVGFATFLKREVYPGPDVAVAGVSYRGYPNLLGRPSTGRPSQQALYADALTIHDTLLARRPVSATVAVGYSLGTAVATHLAAHRRLAGLALVAPPASVRRLAAERYPWLPVRLLLRNPFPTEDLIATLPAGLPVTIIYTREDGLIPPAHVTRILAPRVRGARVVELPGATHGTILYHRDLPGILAGLVAGGGASATTPRGGTQTGI